VGLSWIIPFYTSVFLEEQPSKTHFQPHQMASPYQPSSASQVVFSVGSRAAGPVDTQTVGLLFDDLGSHVLLAFCGSQWMGSLELHQQLTGALYAGNFRE